MAEREELLGFGGTGIARVAMSRGEFTAGGEAKVIAVSASAEAR